MEFTGDGGGDGGDRDWSGLPHHLLAWIVDRVPLPDYVRARAVCTSWQIAAAASEAPKRSQIPMLLLAGDESDDNNEFRNIFFPIFEQNQHIYRLHLPQIRGRRILGSSNGWLITADNTVGDLHLLNPLTGAQIDSLPSITTLSSVLGTWTDDFDGIPASGYIVDFNERAYFRIEEILESFYHKAVILPSPPSFVVFVIHHIEDNLSFARPGDPSWSDPPGLYRYRRDFLDITTHKGQLWGVTGTGVAIAWDVTDSSSPPKLTFVGPEIDIDIQEHFVRPAYYLPASSNFDSPKMIPIEPGIYPSKYYLVESPDGAELMQVWRYQYWVQPREELDGKPDYFGVLPRTKSFRVFRLHIGGNGSGSSSEWIEVKSLGKEGTAIFIGDNNHSISLLTRDLPDLEENRIYFTDGDLHSIYDAPRSRRDIGVFNLSDGSIEPLFPPDSPLNRLSWPPPVWFMPMLNHHA